jgi:hypothetical protein
MYTGIVIQSSGKFTHKILFDEIQLLPLGMGYISWGHLGQSAYDAALTILTHAFGDRKKAMRMAHRFKREIISEMYFNCSWSMSLEEIRSWANGEQASYNPDYQIPIPTYATLNRNIDTQKENRWRE